MPRRYFPFACPNCGTTEHPPQKRYGRAVLNPETLRVDPKGGMVRRYVCPACGHRWYTHQPAEHIISPYQIVWRHQGVVGIRPAGGST